MKSSKVSVFPLVARLAEEFGQLPLQSYNEGKSKVKGLLKKYVYFKYTEMKLILLFNVIPLDFNAPVTALQNFLIPSERKFFWLRL
jgi:hypothetical protein